MFHMPNRGQEIDDKIKQFFENLFQEIFFIDRKLPSKKKHYKKGGLGRSMLRLLGKLIILLARLIKNVLKILFSPVKFFFIASKKNFRKASLCRKFQPVKIFQVLTLSLVSILLSLIIIAYFFFKSLPPIENLTTRKIPMTTKILDRNNKLLYKIYKDQNRSLIHLSDLPQYALDATIAIEDKSFYKHWGISLRGIIRALRENKERGATVQGGSTITQQLVKNALLTPERTLDRKVREIVLALFVERKFSKRQILEMYLNEVGYGGEAYGIEEASQMYFGISARDLSLSQAAFLAGLPASPTDYSPFGANPQIAKIRQLEVLDAMVQEGYITEKEAEGARREKLHFIPQEIPIKAPHFVFFVKELLEKKYGAEFIDQGGLTIKTTLDLDVQDMAQKEVKIGVEKQKYLLVGNGSAVIENPVTGEILAMVGSTDYFNTANDGNVNVTTALRQPGSSIKPVTYSLALSSGLYTTGTTISDSPVTYHTEGSPAYSPQNYDAKFHGVVTLRQALACSYNVPAVKVLASLGVYRLIDFAEKLGITSWTDRNRFGYSLTLGGGEVKPLEMAKVFSVFANEGKKVEQKYVLTITDSKGKVIEDNTFASRTEQVISPIVAFQISDILADNAARTPTFGAFSPLVIPGHTVSVKTGTTDSKKDNWTIGYTKDYTVVVWIGNNNNQPMSIYLESGNTGAAMIWNPIMKNLLKDKKNTPLATPKELIEVEICQQTGTLPCPGCIVKKEYFIRGTEPKEKCTKIEPSPTAEPTKKP